MNPKLKTLASDKRIWAACAALVIGLLVVQFFIRDKKDKGSIPLYTAESGPLTIAVTTSGSVQSRDKEVLISELEGNNTIMWVVDEGKTVKAGDLLLEFDASDLDNRRKEQEVTVINTLSNMEVTRERLEINKADGDAALLDAEVTLKLAEMDMEKFEQGDLPQQLRQLESDIFIKQEELTRKKDILEWSTKLAEQGFLTDNELQSDALAVKQIDVQLESSITKLNVYTNYTVYKERATLDTGLRRAKRNHERTKWQNSAKTRQSESELRAATREYERATNRLGELEFQLAHSKIYAPTNGIVLYATSVQISRRQWWAQPLRVGGTVGRRQELIYLPVESDMIVEAMIPEASLNKLEVNMPAVVKIDAIPGKTFTGKLVKIALLPDGQSSFLNPDLKLYKCEIEFTGSDPNLRSGMSCSVELVRETYKDVIAVPLQCVVRIDGNAFVYMPDGRGGATPVPVEVGLDNNRMIHVTKGLKAGEQILLAPPVPDTADTEKSKPQLQPPSGDAAPQGDKPAQNKKPPRGNKQPK